MLNLARTGLGDKQIAVELGLSPDTVRTYWQRIRRKVGAGTRAEIVATISGVETAQALQQIESEKGVLLEEILRRSTMEKQLRASEQYWRRLADAVPAIVFISDEKAQPLYFNSRFYEYTGLSPNDALKGGWIKTMHRRDVSSVSRELKLRAIDARSAELAIRIKRHDGEYRWHMNRTVPIRNEAGQIVQWFGTSTDIHEEVLVRQELEARQRELDRAHELAKIGQYEYDFQSGLGRWSRNLFLLMDMEPQADWFEASKADKLIHPYDAERVLATVEKARAEESSFDLAYRLVLPSGRTVWVRSVAEAGRDANGNLRLHGTIQDVTETVAKTAELERRTEQMEFAEAATDVGSFYADLARNINEWSPNLYRIVGRDQSLPPLWGPEFSLLIHEDDRERFNEGIRQMREGLPVEMTLRFKRSADCFNLYQFRGSPTSQGGNFGYLRDVTSSLLQHHRTKVVGNAAPFGIFQTDGERRVVYVNNRALEVLGKDIRDLVGRDFFDWMTDATLSEANRKWKEAGEFQMPFEIECPLADAQNNGAVILQVHQFVIEETIVGYVGLISKSPAEAPNPKSPRTLAGW